MTKTQTIADDAPAWAMPGRVVAYISGYGGENSYTAKTVTRHTKTRIFVEVAGKEKGFRLGRSNQWLEVGASDYHEATIHEMGGPRTASIDRANKIRAARREVLDAAAAFEAHKNWVQSEHAEALQEALGRFITTMNAIGGEQ